MVVWARFVLKSVEAVHWLTCPYLARVTAARLRLHSAARAAVVAAMDCALKGEAAAEAQRNAEAAHVAARQLRAFGEHERAAEAEAVLEEWAKRCKGGVGLALQARNLSQKRQADAHQAAEDLQQAKCSLRFQFSSSLASVFVFRILISYFL